MATKVFENISTIHKLKAQKETWDDHQQYLLQPITLEPTRLYILFYRACNV